MAPGVGRGYLREMTNREKLVRDINGLSEAINLALKEVTTRPMTRQIRARIMGSVQYATSELGNLIRQLEQLDAQQGS
jgi:NAD dependent epimerase/dehydratase family enzyme